jgi:apolipoprotein N-acyltransferase
MIAGNLAVAEPVLAHMAGRKIDRRLMVVGASALAFDLVYGIVRVGVIDKRAAASQELTVGTVQANMGLFEKHQNPYEGMNRHMKLTGDLKREGVDLVVWSETSVMNPLPATAYKDAVRDNVGRRLGVPAIVGSVLIDRVGGARGYKLYNSALSTNFRGEVTGRYDKEYLLTFGEYLPFGNMIPKLYEWSPNSGRFEPGTSLEPLVIADKSGNDHKVTTLICYEDILPSFTREAVNHANGESELIVNMTNDAWFGDTTEPWEHLALAQLRAIEHRRYLVRSTNSGVSAIVDPVGRVLSHTKTFQQETLREKIHWMRASTLYEALGDWPWRLAALAVGLMAFVRKRSKNEKK